MSETALKFGPEWLRVLSHGNLSSPPSSPGPIKFKLADFRYGREEMLALYSKDVPPPDGLHNLGSLYIDHIQEPLALLQNGEEQQIWQRPINNDQVIRGPGRAPINGVGRGRGGSVDRGRGRGRGVGAPYYNRGLSYDEECEIRGTREAGPPGMPIRNKSYERSQSIGDPRVWVGERNPMERPTGIGEERSGAVSPKKGRAATDNWRSRGIAEEKGDSWRGIRTDKWGNRTGWRERELEGEWEDGRSQPTAGMRNSSRSWDTDREKDGQRRQWEEDNLPEWATENADDKGGSFDATGAFHAPGSSDDEVDDEAEEPNINREVENHSNSLEVAKSKAEKYISESHKTNGNQIQRDDEKSFNNSIEIIKIPKPDIDLRDNSCNRESSLVHHQPETPIMNGVLSEGERLSLCPSPSKRKEKKKICPVSAPPTSSVAHISVPTASATMFSQVSASVAVTAPTSSSHPIHVLSPNLNAVMPTNQTLQSSNPGPVSMHMERLEEKMPQIEEDNLEHMQSVADDLVAKLVEDDEPRVRIHQPPPGGFLPAESIPHSPPEDQWYYTDPQGDIQGPFSSADMSAWYKLGYFKAALLLRRQCDDKFAQLGDLWKLFGRLPFTPGPPVPPLKVSELINAQKALAEREKYEMMQTQAHILQKQIFQQQQQQQQQSSLRQQQQQQQHVMNSIPAMEEWNHMNSNNPHQMYMQQMMTIPPMGHHPVSINSATVPSSGTSSSHQSSINPELRSSLSSSNTPPLQPHPDPIQAFVAQMASTVPTSNITATSETSITHPPPSTSPIGGESPLQKLLLQLQRGSQSGAGGSLTTPGTSSIIPGHPPPPSNLGTIPTPSLGLEKNPDQYDAIQSLMSQLTKMQMQTPDSLQQEDPRLREEEQKRIEEERRQFEEQKRLEEERIKLQELRLQEERLKEEERRRELEAKNQRLEEELRRIQEEQVRRKKEEEQRIKETENKKKMEQQKNSETNKREEEQKRQQQQLKQKQKQEEEARKKEETRKLEEMKRAEEEAKRKEEQKLKEEHQQKIKEEKKKEEDERKRKKEEKERQQQIQVQEEMRRIALEEERKRMQQLADEEKKKQHQEEQVKLRQQKKAAALQEQAKAVPPAWNNTPVVQEKNNAPSLAEIQKAQEIKDRKEREAEAQREAQRLKEAQRQAAEEKKKQESNLKWASRVSQNGKGNAKPAIGQPQTPEPPVKSLIEIQKEEEKELKKRKQKEVTERASLNHLSLNAAGVWGSASQSLSWANRASSGTAPVITLSSPQANQQPWGSSSPSSSSSSSNAVAWSAIAQSNMNTSSSGWNTETTTTTYNQNSNQNLGGFWESPDTVKYGAGVATGKGVPNPSAGNPNRSPPKASTANQSSILKNAAGIQAVNSNHKVNKKKSKDENETVKKLFADNITPPDNFTQWCKTSLNSLKVQASIDIPTFVGFLHDVESPYEVHDYIRSYLGDAKEVKEFAKQYLERRSRARNAHKERHEEDNILAPAPAVNPVSSLEFQEVKTRLKRGRKKMQKVDNSILGFNVSALERMDAEDEEN